MLSCRIWDDAALLVVSSMVLILLLRSTAVFKLNICDDIRIVGTVITIDNDFTTVCIQHVAINTDSMNTNLPPYDEVRIQSSCCH